jgi:hypothetical protein
MIARAYLSHAAEMRRGAATAYQHANATANRTSSCAPS